MSENGRPPSNIVSETTTLIRHQLESSIANTEIASIAGRYLQDERRSDIQAFLKNPQTRQLAIDQLRNISDRAYRSFVSSLIEGPEKVYAINGSQANVDALAEEMIKEKSPLYTESKYLTTKDKDYRKAEMNYRALRKSSGDKRWLAWDPTDLQHQKDCDSILSEASSRLDEVDIFLESVINKSGLSKDNIISVSKRVKSRESLLNKIGKFRAQPWGKDSTIADAVDLLGGRIVVKDLRTLETVMQSVETMLEGRPELKVLRKENKFVVNHKSPDPYRAIHYVITLPDDGKGVHSVELQLSTFPALIAGDLAHDAVYKPYLLNLPSELQQIVRDYNWESDEKELKEYLNKNDEVVAELSSEQKIEKAISELDYNVFYDLVLNKIDLTKPLDLRTKNLLARFHKKEVEKLEILQESDEQIIIELAQASHDGYFRETSKSFYNLTSDQLGSTIPEEAVGLLTPKAQEIYRNRYENFNGINNKLSIEDLELHKLSDSKLQDFFSAAYKDLTIEGTKIKELINKIQSLRSTDEESERKSTFVMNLNHAPFKSLLDLTEENNPNAIRNEKSRKLFRKVLVAGQIQAIATASLLTEIGGFDKKGKPRDLSEKALAGNKYSLREMLTHMFFITVNRSTSETAPLSFAEFATSPKTAWARDLDKTVDQSILEKIVGKQLISIENAIALEANPVLIARYEKARYDLIGKYLRIMITDKKTSEKAIDYINRRCHEEVTILLENGEQTSKLIHRIKDPLYFKAFTNYLFSESGTPNLLET